MLLNHDSRRRFGLALAGAAALAGGAALGWWMGPSRPAPPATAAQAPPSKPAPISLSPSTAKLPYDLTRPANGSLEDLVAFDAWLASATCEQVWSLLDLHQRPRTLGLNPVLDAMLRQRFRAFPPDERLSVVHAHADPERNFLQVDIEIVADLMQDLLPHRPNDAASVSKFLRETDGVRLAMALEPWAKQDFDAALAFARSFGHPEARFHARLIGYLAATDLPAAQRRVEALPAGTERGESLATVGYYLAQTDLAGALTWVIDHGGGAGRVGAYSLLPATDLLRQVASTDPASVADMMLQQPALFEGPHGPDVGRYVFERWASQDPQAAAAWLQTHSLPESHHVRAESILFSQQLAELPDADVMDAWRSQSEALQKATLASVAARLAEGDPASILDRVAAAFPDNLRREALSQVLSRVPGNPPDQILRWLPDLVPHFARNAGYDHLLTSLPAEKLESALAQLPEADRRSIQERAAEGLIREDPVRALEALPPVNPNRQDPFLYSHLATELLKSDPAKAAEWVAGFTEGTSKEWAAQNLAASWGKFDPDAATTWVENLPPGPSRDRASTELAFLHGITGNHTAGLALAATVQDPDRRLEAAGFVLQHLSRQNPAAARSAAASLNLSAEEQQTLTTRLAKSEYIR
jgi:hypothetical protein